MKKSVIISIFLILLLSSFNFTIALNTTSQNNTNDLKNSRLLNKDIQIPKFLESPARVILGVKDRPVTLDVFIIMILILLMFIFLFQKIAILIPFFDSPAKSWLATVIITILISISGGFFEASDIILSFSDIIIFLRNYPTIKYLLIIIVIIILFISSSGLLKKFKRIKETKEAKKIGRDLSEGSAFARIFAKAGKTLAGKN